MISQTYDNYNFFKIYICLYLDMKHNLKCYRIPAHNHSAAVIQGRSCENSYLY